MTSAILAACEQQRRDEELLRAEPPLVRVWDGEWLLQHVCSVEYGASFSWISNDTGPGRFEIPAESHLALWIADEDGRIARGEGRNVHVTVDYCGVRWGGRMDKFAIEGKEDGDRVMTVDFLHDYENLKWYSVWSNPWLLSALQFPRAFLLAGPVTWVLKISLLLQLIREHNPLITMVDDPLDFASWFTSLDMSTWSIVVKPGSFIDAMNSGVTWGMVSSRWSNWHDMAHALLEDAELSVQCTRWLTGDPAPWPGANLRNGTLVIDIIDKSGVYVGTSHGGSAFDGLIRTAVEFADDFIDSTENVINDTSVPADYFLPGNKYTAKEVPYVVFIEGDEQNNSPIQSTQWVNSPAKGVQVNAGGHSMPGVNETISATIQFAGDMLGNLVQVGSLGGTIDTLLKPLYEDTILAWWSIKSLQRAQHSGWSRYFEYFQDGADKAYTIASLMVLRAGFWATKTVVSWKVNVLDGLPYVVGGTGNTADGGNGLGHFFLDDRVGLILAADPDRKIHMDRCRKIELAWDDENPAEWTISIGDDRIWQDPAQRAWGRIERLIAGLRDLGVW